MYQRSSASQQESRKCIQVMLLKQHLLISQKVLIQISYYSYIMAYFAQTSVLCVLK